MPRLDGLGIEDVDAVDLAAVGRACVDAGEGVGGGVSVGGGDLGGSPVASRGHRRSAWIEDGRVDHGDDADAVGVAEEVAGGRELCGDLRLNHGRDAGVELGSGADVGVETERCGELLAEVGADRAAVDASDDLADEPAEGHGVIAVFLTRRPPGFLLGEGRGHGFPVEHVLGDELALDGGHAGLVAEQPANGD